MTPHRHPMCRTTGRSWRSLLVVCFRRCLKLSAGSSPSQDGPPLARCVMAASCGEDTWLLAMRQLVAEWQGCRRLRVAGTDWLPSVSFMYAGHRFVVWFLMV